MDGPAAEIVDMILAVSASASRTVSRVPSVVASCTVSRAPSVLEIVAAVAPPSAVASRTVSRAPSVLEPVAVASPSAVASQAVSRTSSVLAKPAAASLSDNVTLVVQELEKKLNATISRLQELERLAAMPPQTLNTEIIDTIDTSILEPAAAAPPSAVSSRTVSRTPSVLEPAAAAPPSAVASRTVSRTPSVLEPAAAAPPSAVASRTVSRTPSVLVEPAAVALPDVSELTVTEAVVSVVPAELEGSLSSSLIIQELEKRLIETMTRLKELELAAASVQSHTNPADIVQVNGNINQDILKGRHAYCFFFNFDWQ